MAGFESIVRPTVLPNIRPAPAQTLPPQDDPAQDIVNITGGSGTFMGTSLSWDVTVSKQMPKTESARLYDVDRVYQKEEDGTVNKENYLDVLRTKAIRLELQSENGPEKILLRNPEPADNVKTIQHDLVQD